MMISAVDRVRLAALLSMLGSEHVGERDNAAQLVERFRQQRGLTWGDVLTARGLTNVASAPPGRRPEHGLSASESNPANTTLVIQSQNSRDSVWRWSMLAGLLVVGSMSFTTLMQQRAAEHRIEAKAATNGLCPSGTEGDGWSACRPVAHGQDAVRSPSAPAPSLAAATPPSVAAAAAAALPTPFAQGLADRKVWESWRKSNPAGLCSGPFRPDQEELKSACAIAGKLLAKFDQRRRTDPEYRRGWNSLSA